MHFQPRALRWLSPRTAVLQRFATLRLDQPTKGISIELDYSDTDIPGIRALDFIAGVRPRASATSLTQFPVRRSQSSSMDGCSPKRRRIVSTSADDVIQSPAPGPNIRAKPVRLPPAIQWWQQVLRGPRLAQRTRARTGAHLVLSDAIIPARDNLHPRLAVATPPGRSPEAQLARWADFMAASISSGASTGTEHPDMTPCLGLPRHA
ncbi:MAG: hypothetical protein QOI06_2868 [Nocardioidaceae bacterium]|nr:hypothetical protein [Nocardioidaceae bacterium]